MYPINHNPFAEPTAYVAQVNGAAVFETNLVRDKLGRITQKTEATNGQMHTELYAYDLAGRLASVTRDGNLLVSYTYDGNSNRIAATTENGTVHGTVDAQDRLTAYGSETFVYNATGQLTGRTNTDTNETTLYQYDVYGNLKHVLLPNGTNLDYVVDGLNRRIGKKANGQLIQGWLYANPLAPIAELDGQGHLVSRFVYADRRNVPSLMIKAGKTYRLIADHLGSPRLVINVQTGEIVQRMDYDVWGKVTLDTNPGFQPFGFAGGLYDRDTGLVRFGARDYDPVVGRWTAKEPKRFLSSVNFYAYSFNDPVNYYDLTGLDGRLNLFNANEPAHQIAENYISPIPDAFVLAGHASSTRMEDRRSDISGKNKLYADDLANELKKSGWRPGEPIDIIGCHAGMDPGDGNPPLAQQIADALDTPVRATDKYTFFWPPDRVESYEAVPGNGPHGKLPDYDKPGNWIIFH